MQWKNGQSFFTDFRLELMRGNIPNENQINYDSRVWKGKTCINKLNFIENIPFCSVEILSKNVLNFFKDQDVDKIITPEIISQMGGVFNKTGVWYMDGHLVFYRCVFRPNGYCIEITQYKGNQLWSMGGFIKDFKSNKKTLFNLYNYNNMFTPAVILWAFISDFLDEDQLVIKESLDRKIFTEVGKKIFNPDGVGVKVIDFPILQEIKGHLVKAHLVFQPYGPKNSFRKFIIRKGSFRKTHTRTIK